MITDNVLTVNDLKNLFFNDNIKNDFKIFIESNNENLKSNIKEIDNNMLECKSYGFSIKEKRIYLYINY
jgi:hypothetical protein